MKSPGTPRAATGTIMSAAAENATASAVPRERFACRPGPRPSRTPALIPSLTLQRPASSVNCSPIRREGERSKRRPRDVRAWA